MQTLNSLNRIVIVGHWNLNSFSPAWVKDCLCNNKDEAVKVALPVNLSNLPNAPIQINFEGIYLILNSQSLEIVSEQGGSASLSRCGQVAKRILSDLSQTPVSAIGININFEEMDSPETILGCIAFNDAKKIDAAKYKYKSGNIKRSYFIDNNDLLNLDIIIDDSGKVKIQFNFHADVPNTQICLKKLEVNPPEKAYEQAIIFMKDVYNIELNEGGQGNNE